MHKNKYFVIGLALVLASALFQKLLAQDSPSAVKKYFSVMGGACATLKLYKSYDGGNPKPANIPSTYYGPTLSVYYNSIKSSHYLFQTGIEYTYAKYFIPYLSFYDNRYKNDWYSNVNFVANTFSIPAYFNLLLFKQRFYLGAGPQLDFIYSIANCDKIYSSSALQNNSSLSNPLGIGICTKMGSRIPLNASTITIEARIKSAITGMFPKYYGNSVYNEYASLSIGFAF